MDYELKDFHLDSDLKSIIKEIQGVINQLNTRRDKGLNHNLKKKLFNHLKLSQVYNSNAIEGNILSLRETELILDNMQLNERPLKDQIEARTLNNAIDFLHDCINGKESLSKRTLLELHQIIMTGIENINGGVFRKSDVQIKGSEHTPPGWLEVEDQINQLFEWYSQTESYFPIVRAAILHHWLTWIHPFEDGNGRVSRLMLNFLLMQCGYPEIVIRIEERDRYYESLISADRNDLAPLIELICDKLLETTTVYEEFLNEEERDREWLNKYTKIESDKRLETHKYNYEVWKSAMDIFKARFEQSYSLIHDKIPSTNMSFRDYGVISFKQYLDILEDRKVSNTWFFSLGIHNYESNQKLAIIFYFDRHYPKLKKKVGSYTSMDGKIRPKYITTKQKKPIIKLYASVRQGGQSKPLPETVDFFNVGMKGDKMIIGVRDSENRNYIKSEETNMATPLIRDFFDQVIETYSI